MTGEIDTGTAGLIATIAFGVVALILAIAIALAQRRRHTLDYWIRDKVRIVSPNAPEVRSDLRVLYGASRREVVDPWLVIVEVVNTGRHSVSADHYGDQPIRFSWQTGEALAATIGEQSSDGSVHQSDVFEERSDQGVLTSWTVRPDWLHPKQRFRTHLLFDGDPGTVSVRARFADSTRNMRDLDRDADRTLKRTIVYGPIAFAVLLILFALLVGADLDKLTQSLLGIAVVIGVALGTFFTMSRGADRVFREIDRRRRRKRSAP